MLMGPLRLKAYSSPIRALPHSELAWVLSVVVLLYLEDRADLQMVLQVFAYARNILDDRNTQRLQAVRRSQAGELQNLW
jgi:hypothetical protein